MDFLETNAACDLDIGRCKQLDMNIQGQGHFLTLAQGHFHIKISALARN